MVVAVPLIARDKESPREPRLAGNWFIRPRSKRARIAAVPSVSAAEAPLVTSAASVPVTSAIRREAAACSSSIDTLSPAAALIASTTRADIIAPPNRVTVPVALMRGVTFQRA